MKKGLITVFIILGILIIALILWGVVFNNGGLDQALKAIIDPINGIWQSMTGQNTNNLITTNFGNINQGNLSAANDSAFKVKNAT